MSNISRDDVTKAVELAIHVGAIIRDHGPIPSGVLYSMLMHTMSLPTYDSLITLLVNQNLVRRGTNHMLHWIGDSHNGSSEATARY